MGVMSRKREKMGVMSPERENYYMGRMIDGLVPLWKMYASEAKTSPLLSTISYRNMDAEQQESLRLQVDMLLEQLEPLIIILRELYLDVADRLGEEFDSELSGLPGDERTDYWNDLITRSGARAEIDNTLT